MTWQIFPNVTFTNGSKNIAVNDSTATAGILAGYAVNKDNKSYEIESITSSAIILVDAWAEATTANVKIKIQPTSEPIKEYIQETLGEVKGLVADYLARLQLEESIISSTGTVSFTDSAGVSHDIPGWGNLPTAILNEIQKLGPGNDNLASTRFTGDLDSLTITKLTAGYGSELSNKPIGVSSSDRVVIIVLQYNASNIGQRLMNLATGATYFRSLFNNSWSAWVEAWTDANYQPLVSGSGLNTPRIMLKGSGGTVASAETIIGSSLQYVYGNSSGNLVASSAAVPPGTWRNVSGIGISSGSFGVFVREL